MMAIEAFLYFDISNLGYGVLIKNNEYFYSQKKMELPAEQAAEPTWKLRQGAVENRGGVPV